MKRIHLLLICALCLASATLQARTVQEAAQIASQFISQSHVAPAQRMQRAAAATYMTKPVDLVYTQYQINTTTPAVYVFNNQEEEGFVLVSAEDNARAILGYSDNGTFDANNIPQNMQFWLQMYANEIKQAGDEAMQQKANGKEAIGNENTSKEYPTIAPILGETIWGQNEPYNLLCPTVNGITCVTGCLATAISQIMYAHKYPSKGIGSKTYTSISNELNLSVDFSATTYDWENMLPNYYSDYTDIQANAVATLMYHVGVAIEMDYGPYNSSASFSNALANLAKHFGYDKGIQPVPRDYLPEAEVMNTIITDLQAGRPIFVAGSTANNEGHAFVCDGMQSDGYIHINWGWDGSSDGYFALSALDPYNQGTGGSVGNYAYTERIIFYTNIQPDKGGKAQPQIIANTLTRNSADTINKNEYIEFTIGHFDNTSIIPITGNCYYYIYNNNQELVHTAHVWSFDLLAGYYYYEPIQLFAKLPNDFANGNYELEIRYTDDQNIDYPFLVKGLGGGVRTPFTVIGDQVFFRKTPAPDVEIRAISKANFTNIAGTKTWLIDLYSTRWWDNDVLNSEAIISCSVNSASSTSITGTYILDNTNSGKPGTINIAPFYAEGCKQQYNSFDNITDLHITIIPESYGYVTIQYYIEIAGEPSSHSFTTSGYRNDVKWLSYDTNLLTYSNYSDSVTYDLAASISMDDARNLIQSMERYDTSKISYFVSGAISNIYNTQEEIALKKQANFDVKDDITDNNPFYRLYCCNTKWLNNTYFTTGEEITLGDTVVILGKLQNNDRPECNGYIYHTSGVDYTLQNLQWESNGSTLYFWYESIAPYFHVKLYSGQGIENTIINNAFIDNTVVSISYLNDGIYTLWVQPIGNAQTNNIYEPILTTLTIDQSTTVDYSVYNITTIVEYSTLNISWECAAPYVQITLISEEGKSIFGEITDAKQITVHDLLDGTYNIRIRPVHATQMFYLGYATTMNVTINTSMTSCDNILGTEVMYLYDLMGRLVDTKPYDDNRPFNVPQSGIYILNRKKVFIWQ